MLQEVLAMDPGVKRMGALAAALINSRRANLTPEECAPAVSALQDEQLRKNAEKRLSEALERLVQDEQAEEEISQALSVAENVGLRLWKDDTSCKQAEMKLRLVRWRLQPRCELRDAEEPTSEKRKASEIDPYGWLEDTDDD
jgi:hypothetical protein